MLNQERYDGREHPRRRARTSAPARRASTRCGRCRTTASRRCCRRASPTSSATTAGKMGLVVGDGPAGRGAAALGGDRGRPEPRDRRRRRAQARRRAGDRPRRARSSSTTSRSTACSTASTTSASRCATATSIDDATRQPAPTGCRRSRPERPTLPRLQTSIIGVRRHSRAGSCGAALVTRRTRDVELALGPHVGEIEGELVGRVARCEVVEEVEQCSLPVPPGIGYRGLVPVTTASSRHFQRHSASAKPHAVQPGQMGRDRQPACWTDRPARGCSPIASRNSSWRRSVRATPRARRSRTRHPGARRSNTSP